VNQIAPENTGARDQEKGANLKSASCLISAALDLELVAETARGCLGNLEENPDLAAAFVSYIFRKNLSQLIVD
jgi:hypothetical protein